MEGGSKKRQRDSETLGRLLRATDPAAGHDGLGGVERARMREAIVEEAARRAGKEAGGAFGNAWRQPALAAATVLLVALALAYGIFYGSTGGSAREATPGRETTETPAIAGQPPQVDEASNTDARATGGTPRAIETMPSVSAPAASAVSSAAIAALPPPGSDRATEATSTPTLTGPSAETTATESSSDRQPRTLYFTAPRGTQIIWTLDPEYVSPIAGQPARQ